jgi:putative tricarboxylic transport membrane protein
MIFASNWLLRIIRVPTRFLGVTILTLSFVGVYSLRNSTTDCAIAAAFGVLGVILKRQNLPIVPIVLGIVLGGIMEVKLRSAMAQVKTPLDFVNRPIAALIALAIVALIGFHFWGVIRERRAALREFEHDHDLHDTQMR